MEHRASSVAKTGGEPFVIAGWRVDPVSLRLSNEKRTIKLEPKVMAVLDYLACSSGAVVSRQELEDKVWAGTIVGYDSIGNVIIKLRKAFGDKARKPRIIETIAKTGYRLIAEVSFEGQAEQLKATIAESEMVYSEVIVDSETAPLASVAPVRNKPEPRHWWTIVLTTVVLIMLVIGIASWWQLWAPKDERASLDKMAFPLPDKPSIAVLPFINISNEAEQEYFADGMTDDLITDLSKLSGLFVIARNSTFTYKGKPVNVRQVAEELGVRYVLKGSVRRVGEQVRVNVQLIDATTGGHVWADRFDGNVADTFSLQDEFIRKIVKALAVNLTKDEQEEIALGQTSNIEAREVFQKGWESYLLYSAEDNAVAISQFEAALEIDPEYGRAYAALSLSYLRGCQLRWNEPLKMSLGAANVNALTYLNETKRYPSSLANVAASGVHLYNNRHEAAVTEATLAIARDPNDPEAYIAMAWAMITTGRPGPGLELVERAMRLNPTYPDYYVLALGIAYFALDDLETAAAVFRQALERDPGAIELIPPLAATYARLGLREEAQASLLLWKPGASQGELQNIPTSYHFPYSWSGDREIEDRLIDGLYIAAFPLETTVSSIMDTMKHGNKFKRRRAITDLGRFGSAAASAIPTLIEALGAEDLAIRNQAATTLGKIGPDAQAAVPTLTAMQAEGGIVGEGAGVALRKIKGE